MSDFFIDEKRPWLGGFKTGPQGDEATYFDRLWVWLVNDMKIESVVDIGCGAGIATNFFETLLPKTVVGVDGIAQNQSNIYQHDFTEGPWYPPLLEGQLVPRYDLCWCCETVEHIEEQFLPHLLETFQCCKYVLMTHAFPGQAGHNHVNCRTSNYWLGVMAGAGYRLDPDLTAKTKELSRNNTSPWNHWLRSGMAFVRN